ncbi:MAG: DegT/DnrJ/EryC1/StrS family aminotransferase [Chloroflexi bacterium]|nr:DegT/DnrJ/EryC1/StrS family aminotransferase [Chloroflexota bacterium]
MTIPLVDLRKQYLGLEEEIMARIGESLRNMQLFLGENVQALEEEFAAFSGARHGVGVGSGTDAIHLALRALGIGQGDEVITVSHTFVATAGAIAQAGARPVFVDIDPVTMNMDPTKIEAAITPRTKAIMPVHLYGHPADMDPIMEIAKRHDLRVIEDACQAHGATYKGRLAGSIGDVACFSFYFSKNLGAYGEAGMLVSNDDEIVEKARILRDHGSSEKYVHVAQGFNARLDEIQATILRVKLARLEGWNSRRRQLAKMYAECLSSLPLTLPTEMEWANSVYHLFVVRTPERDSLLQWLHDHGVMAGIHYPIPIHMQEPYKEFAPEGGLPVTEKVAQEILSLPIYPELTSEQVEEVVGCIFEFFAANGHSNAGSLPLQGVAVERRA